MARRRPVSIEPRCIISGALEEAFQELDRLATAILESAEAGKFSSAQGGEYGGRRQTGKQREQVWTAIESALSQTRTYSRVLRATSHLRHLDTGAPDFDDHDQVSSALLYLLASFDRLYDHSAEFSRGQIMERVLETWYQGPKGFASAFQERLRDPLAEFKPASIGILTALEIEFQSVMRRLDRVLGCTDDSCYGFALLDRRVSSEDVRDNARYLARASVPAGWGAGYIGEQKVVVVCTGNTGGARVADAIERIVRKVGRPSIWLVVGICAGTARSWPIGSVLVSKDWILPLVRPSKKFLLAEDDVMEPVNLGSVPARFRMEHLYRRGTMGGGTMEGASSVRVAQHWRVPCFETKFACSPHKVGKEAQREQIRQELETRGYLQRGEEFGIEMEGPGLTEFGGAQVGIIKSVCDYGDESFDRWPPELKVKYQLYAAETAAEATRELIRAWTEA